MTVWATTFKLCSARVFQRRQSQPVRSTSPISTKCSNGGSALIDNPGVMFSDLLLMGDRQIEGSKSATLYSNLWGAGRFKMRKPDPAGLDSPAVWKNNSVCVEENEIVSVIVNTGNVLSADVDDFKAVIYWYDRQHELGAFIDDIDLDLINIATGVSLVSSASVFDEKERVYHAAIGPPSGAPPSVWISRASR